jgi:hypothetical protein
MAKCVGCGKEIGEDNWEAIKKIYSDILIQVDEYGEDSLSEDNQLIYNNLVHVQCVRFTEDDLPF